MSQVNTPTDWHTASSDLSSIGVTEAPVVIGSPIVKASHQIPERQSWSNMTLTIIRGACEVIIDQKTVRLETGSCHKISAHVEHQIKALVDLRAVVGYDAEP